MTRLADGRVAEGCDRDRSEPEGEATATYLARFLESAGITVSRLASGPPVGGDLEYADEVTLGRAFAGAATSRVSPRRKSRLGHSAACR